LECRLGCGACCIAPSISSPIPGMPNGKPAGTRCVQLSDDNLCLLFGSPERPATCLKFTAEYEICADSGDKALANLIELENITAVDQTRN